MNEQLHQIELIKAQAKVELNKLEANSPAKDVAGRAIGKHGLFYITLIVTIGVASSLVLDGIARRIPHGFDLHAERNRWCKCQAREARV